MLMPVGKSPDPLCALSGLLLPSHSVIGHPASPSLSDTPSLCLPPHPPSAFPLSPPVALPALPGQASPLPPSSSAGTGRPRGQRAGHPADLGALSSRGPCLQSPCVNLRVTTQKCSVVQASVALGALPSLPHPCPNWALPASRPGARTLRPLSLSCHHTRLFVHRGTFSAA